MANTPRQLPFTSRPEHIFPTLTQAQVARVAAHGRVRSIERGQVLVQQGDASGPLFVVKSGELEVVRPDESGETLIAVHRPGQFSGEVNTLSGRRALNRIRASETGEVIELARESLLSMVQLDSELSEILMRAFILRRVELLAAGI